VSTRVAFRDETWRLAVAGDVAGLERAGELLLSGDDGTLGYDGHRAHAFARAVEGRVEDALAELNEGWTDEWPFPSAYAADVARVHYVAGDCRQALDALELAARSADVLDPAVAELAIACVEREPDCWTAAFKVALAGGSPPQRVRNGLAVMRARL
jgi:hypothetical protein